MSLAKMLPLALLLAGCATLQGFHSVEEVDLTPAQADTLARDTVSQIAQAYPPGSTTFVLSRGGALGDALEQALRAQGYAVTLAADKKEGEGDGGERRALRYLLSPYEEGMVLSVQAGDGFQLNRLYGKTAEGVAAQSGMTVIAAPGDAHE